MSTIPTELWAILIPILTASIVAIIGSVFAGIKSIQNHALLLETKDTLTAQNNDADLKGKQLFAQHLITNDVHTKVMVENADLRARLAAARDGTAGDVALANKAATDVSLAIASPPLPPLTIAEQVAESKKIAP